MSIVSYFSVTSTAARIPSDPSVPPKKNPPKPVGSASYGGASTGTGSGLRKYWGGEEEDPLSSDGFIWNKDFVGRFKRMIQDPSSASLESSPVKDQEESAGFLNLNRVMSLDSLEVDLSKDLGPVSKTELEQPVRPPSKRSESGSPKWRLAPTRREQDKWDRASKAATGGTEVMFWELRRPQGDPKLLAAQSKEEYMKFWRRAAWLLDLRTYAWQEY